MENQNKTIDFNGIELNLSASLGTIFAEKFLAEISEKDYEKINEFLIEEIFNGENYQYKTAKTEEEKKAIAERMGKYDHIKTGNNNGWNHTVSLCEQIRQTFNKEFVDDVMERVREIQKTDEYKDKVNEIAEEFLEFTLDGWKAAAKQRFIQRLIDDPIDKTYYGTNIRSIIQEEVYNMMNR